MKAKKDNLWKKLHGRRVIPQEHQPTVRIVLTVLYLQACRERDAYRARAARDAEGVHLETYRHWRSVAQHLQGVLNGGGKSLGEFDYLAAVAHLVSDGEPVSIQALTPGGA
jgi:hypothetical protein